MSLEDKLKALSSAQPTNYHEDTKKLIEQISKVHSELDNILVRQKDMILEGINKAKDGTDLVVVIAQTRILVELWDVLNYSYKTNEVLTKIQDKMDALKKRKEAKLQKQAIKELMEDA